MVKTTKKARGRGVMTQPMTQTAAKKRQLVQDIVRLCRFVPEVEPESVLMELAAGNPLPLSDVVLLVWARQTVGNRPGCK